MVHWEFSLALSAAEADAAFTALLTAISPGAARTDVPAQAMARQHSAEGTDLVAAAPASGPRKLSLGLAPDTCIMHVNIQGLLSHLAELHAFTKLRRSPPDIVCVNETFLDSSVEAVELDGFFVVGNRDRSYGGDRRKCGGVIVYARAAIADHVALLLTSEVAERMWFQFHTNNGPYLLCAWHRPPVQGVAETIASFGAELGQLRSSAIGTILIGDLNLHSKRWLIHSASNSKEGEQMRDLCNTEGLRQMVRKPTRGDYLLDLTITDVQLASVEVSTRIADHAVLMAWLNLGIPECCSHRRKVWVFAKADWDGLKEDFRSFDWFFVDVDDANEGADQLTRMILSSAALRIPQKTITCQRKSHTWLNDRVVELVAKKHAAKGTPDFAEAVLECSKGMAAEFAKYASGMRTKT